MNRKTFIITLLSAIATAFTGKAFQKRKPVIICTGGEFQCAQLQMQLPDHFVVGTSDPALHGEEIRRFMESYPKLPIWFDEYRSHGHS